MLETAFADAVANSTHHYFIGCIYTAVSGPVVNTVEVTPAQCAGQSVSAASCEAQPRHDGSAASTYTGQAWWRSHRPTLEQLAVRQRTPAAVASPTACAEASSPHTKTHGR